MTMPVAARIAAWAAEGQVDALAALEALADPRLSPPGAPGLPATRLLREATALVRGGSAESLADELAAAGATRAGDLLLLAPGAAAEARPALAAAAAARAVSWSREPLTQGRLLSRFAAHCGEHTYWL